jgi:hypothetical protein
MHFSRRFLPLVGAVALGLVTVAPADGLAQTILPGTTIRDNCTIYKEIDSDPEFIFYYQCNDGTTAKSINYIASDGEVFLYLEFRDQNGNLFGSRFGRQDHRNGPVIPLADSKSP